MPTCCPLYCRPVHEWAACRLLRPEACGLAAGTPIVLGGHDHLCAALAAGAINPGDLVDSTGTAQALLFVLSGFLSKPELAASGFPCYPHVVPEKIYPQRRF